MMPRSAVYWIGVQYGYGYSAGCCIDRGRGEEGIAGGDMERG